MHPAAVQEGRIPQKDMLPSFADIQSAVGFPEYYAEAARYAVRSPAEPAEPEATDTARTSEGTKASAAAEVAVEFLDDVPSTSEGSPDGPSAEMGRCATLPSFRSCICQSNHPNTPVPGWPCCSASEVASSSLQEELRSLDLDDGGDRAQNSTTAGTNNGTTRVVEPDAVVLSSSGRQEGGEEPLRMHLSYYWSMPC